MPGSDYGGLSLNLSTELEDLPTARSNRPPDLTVAVEATPVTEPSSWVHHWISDDIIILSLARIQGRHVLRFEDGTLFEFDPSKRTVTCPPLVETVRHQLLDHVLPRVLDDVGHLMIHGSAVDTPNGAIVFVGDSGLGKSTLAASFQSVGIDLLSDDCIRLALGPAATVTGTPTYRSLRLWPDSVSTLMATARFDPMSATHDKQRVRLPEAVAVGNATVAAICVLSAPPANFSGIQLNELAPSRSMALLLGQCFRLDPTDAEATKRAFERVAKVVERVQVVELVYDRSYERLPDVRDAVLKLSAASGLPPVTLT